LQLLARYLDQNRADPDRGDRDPDPCKCDREHRHQNRTDNLWGRIPL
jgi:hypothetical protein